MVNVSVRKRAEALFSAYNAKLPADLKAMYADQAAKGALGSGDTLRNAVHLYGARMTEALDLCCEAIARRNDHRGRRWKADVEDVRVALQIRFESDDGYLDEPLRVARQAPDSGASRAISALLKRRSPNFKVD